MIDYLAILTKLLIDYHSGRVVPEWRHETEESRIARIERIARGNIRACEQQPVGRFQFDECLALVSTLEKFESGLILEVHAGTTLGKAGERCLGQLHRTVTKVPDKHRITPEELEATTGLSQDATNVCALGIAKTFAHHSHRCTIDPNRSWLDVAVLFTEYHSPGMCVGSGAGGKRARAYQTMVRQIRAEASKQEKIASAK
jgi:hypothetical protein